MIPRLARSTAIPTLRRLFWWINFAQGLDAKAQAVTSGAETSNVGEDSAWRAAMRNEDGNMELLLLLVARQDPALPAKIQSIANIALIGEDSASRAFSCVRHTGSVALR